MADEMEIIMKVLKIFVATLLLVIASIANAETITYKSVGTISAISGPDVGCSFAIGGRAKTCNTIPADTFDDVLDPAHGFYTPQGYMEWTVGDCTFINPPGMGYIFVYDNLPDDRLAFSSGINDFEPELFSRGSLNLRLIDASGTMFSSDALPLSDTNFNIASEKYAILEATTLAGDQVEVSINIDTFYVDPVGCGATIEELIAELMAFVVTLNLQVGIENSLDIKLQLILDTLADLQGNNFNSMVAKLEAFIHEVEEQSGTNISEEDANYMLEIAQQILKMILEML